VYGPAGQPDISTSFLNQKGNISSLTSPKMLLIHPVFAVMIQPRRKQAAFAFSGQG
jgi:hypothetical protein